MIGRPDGGSGERRPFGDRPRRDFGDRKPRSDNGYAGERRSFADRAPRETVYGDRPRSDRPAVHIERKQRRTFGDDNRPGRFPDDIGNS